MKKLVLLLACMFSIQVAMADHSKAVTFDQLPQKAQTFIKTHFPKEKVSFAKEERDFFDKEYEVLLTKGDKVEFTSKGEWKKVKAHRGSFVPESIVPAPIKQVIAEQYPDAKVREIEKDRLEYEVKLDNRYELTFNSDLVLIDVDYDD